MTQDDLFRTISGGNLRLTVLRYGARVHAIEVLDEKTHRVFDPVVGYGDLRHYLTDQNYLGAVVGRTAGRIVGGEYHDGVAKRRLTRNASPHCLHGGIGLSNRYWEWGANHGDAVGLSYTSTAGEDGFPGEMRVDVIYAIADESTIRVTYSAEATERTPLNMTQHTYFNLHQESGRGIESHEIQVLSDSFVPIADDWVPECLLLPVERGCDLRRPRPIARVVRESRLGHGDLYRVIGESGAKQEPSSAVRPVAYLRDPITQRFVEVRSSQPFVQIYTGIGLASKHFSKQARPLRAFDGIAIECQHVSNGVNCKVFDPPWLDRGDRYHHVLEWCFG